MKDQSEKLEPDSSYEAQAEKILEDPNVSKEVSPDLVKNWPLLVFLLASGSGMLRWNEPGLGLIGPGQIFGVLHISSRLGFLINIDDTN